MLKVKDFIEKLKHYDEEADIKVEISDKRFLNEIDYISFVNYLDNDYKEVILYVNVDEELNLKEGK